MNVMPERPLTLKQRRFIDAYLGPAFGNGTEAARVAGYRGNDATLAVIGSENLTKPKILKAIGKRIEMDPERLERERRILDLSAIARDRSYPTRHRLKALLNRLRRRR